MKKIELIYFHTKRLIDNNNYLISIKNNQIKPKNLVRWLEIWLDFKLSFKEYVKIKIAAATRTFYQIVRLLNTKRDLSFQAIRQLYIACITLITDYSILI